MTYEEFVDGIEKYWMLFEQGLKKQANKHLFDFAERFKKEVTQEEGDVLLFRFCADYIDSDRFDDHKRYGDINLPFQLTGLLNDYFVRECRAEKMPQMRWAVQVFGRYYNPHDSNRDELKTYDILKRAYEHPDCDQKTVDLYLDKQVECLEFGAHHFPEGCCITREEFEDTIKTAERIIAERKAPDQLTDEVRYFKALYELYYKWHDGGRAGDFAELCAANDVPFHAVKAYYYG
ncbi:MAG: hypothetical protein K2N38_03990 [Oscillospiraceae bacterium]|nr:hypothetical protein [Oscillospiraceae bacterium]